MKSITVSLIFLVVIMTTARSQISPGELAAAHAHLEGMSNCTQCHSLGSKISNEKCLACHAELKARIDQKKGYHVSQEVRSKACVSCHSDHHGRNFQLIRFAKEKFDHGLTGFALSGAHTTKQCNDCHKPANISNPAIRKKRFTYLGLSPECKSCHSDYHQGTISKPCVDCHNTQQFKPAALFNHSASRFMLTGRHTEVACAACHPVTLLNGKKFQQFAGIKHQNCSNCHQDPHNNQFGPRCLDCHVTASFRTVKGIGQFDHSKTAFPLENRHRGVACKSCHKKGLTDPVKHERCLDCHADFHEGQFNDTAGATDCSGCHSTRGFQGSSFTIERHNSGKFILTGAHLATPCFSCHNRKDRWVFRDIGSGCGDCHENVHGEAIDSIYNPVDGCKNCHSSTAWSLISFDHNSTAFPLSGQHAKQSCRTCHFRMDPNGKSVQMFSSMKAACTQCHTDIHNSQFETDGETQCLRCHASDNWKIPNFDHSKTAFRLDGKHEKLACISCHKTVVKEQHTFVLYKTNKLKCENCH